MAFEEYGAKPEGEGRDPHSISFSVYKGSRGDTYTLSVILGTGVVKERGFEAGGKVALYFGTGDDKGKLLIKGVATEAKNACKLAYNGGKGKKDAIRSLKIQKAVKPIKPIEDFTNKVLEAVKVKWEWDEAQEGIVIEIPPGFFAE